ncbi:MAG TPA: CorA family divalent cation transporter [Flavobacterium sp.]|nr:CorA family divalent cation transporter [Flavobacterium sp.]
MSIRTINIPDEKLVWVDLQNPTKEEQNKIAAEFELDLYALSDSVEPNHLPKFEEQAEMNFFIVRQRINNSRSKVNVHQISRKIAVFYNKDVLITIHRGEIPFIDEIIQKFITTKKVKTINGILIRLLKEVLMSYEESLLKLSDEVYEFEENMFVKETPTHSLQQLFYLKNKANLSRRLLVLTDEVLNNIQVNRHEKASMQDVKDLYTKLMVLYDQAIEEVSSLQNIFISISSQKTNEVMKTLTIFSMFFLPLTFIVGIYGMNFKYMPELDYWWAYPACLALMVLVALAIYLWFKHKKWM